MAIFAAGSVQNTTVTNSATKVFNSLSTLYVDGATGTDLTLVNTGTTTCFVGIAAVTVTGLRLAPGQQIVINGWKYLLGATKGNTAGDVYAITASGTTTIEAGFATGNTVV